MFSLAAQFSEASRKAKEEIVYFAPRGTWGDAQPGALTKSLWWERSCSYYDNDSFQTSQWIQYCFNVASLTEHFWIPLGLSRQLLKAHAFCWEDPVIQDAMQFITASQELKKMSRLCACCFDRLPRLLHFFRKFFCSSTPLPKITLLERGWSPDMEV